MARWPVGFKPTVEEVAMTVLPTELIWRDIKRASVSKEASLEHMLIYVCGLVIDKAQEQVED